MISIITINYNNAEGLRKTIESVKQQSEAPYEFIVVDGNSTDGSKEVMRLYKNDFTISVSETDSGVYEAMNKGILKATGDYLYFLNSGDVFYSKTTLSQLHAHLGSAASIYYGAIEVAYPNNNKKIRKTPAHLDFGFFIKRTIPHQASLIKRELFHQIGLYNEKLKIVSDWEFFVIAICKYEVQYEALDLVFATYDASGISSKKENKQLFRAEKRSSLETHFSPFIKGYDLLTEQSRILKTERFKILRTLETSKVARKLNSLWLRSILFLLKGKRAKDI